MTLHLSCGHDYWQLITLHDQGRSMVKWGIHCIHTCLRGDGPCPPLTPVSWPAPGERGVLLHLCPRPGWKTSPAAVEKVQREGLRGKEEGWGGAICCCGHRAPASLLLPPIHSSASAQHYPEAAKPGGAENEGISGCCHLFKAPDSLSTSLIITHQRLSLINIHKHRPTWEISLLHKGALSVTCPPHLILATLQRSPSQRCPYTDKYGNLSFSVKQT